MPADRDYNTTKNGLLHVIKTEAQSWQMKKLQISDKDADDLVAY